MKMKVLLSVIVFTLYTVSYAQNMNCLLYTSDAADD